MVTNNNNHMFVFLIKFPITAIREIKILKKLHHENVIHLKEIVTSPGNNNNNNNEHHLLVFIL